MVHELSGQSMSDLSPSLTLSVTRSHALSELAGLQEIIYVNCLSDSVLGYQLAVLPLAGEGWGWGGGKEVLSSIEEQYFASRILYIFIASLVPSLLK